MLGLDEFFHSTARELSLGQRMRADLGMAIIHEPEILFLDEPTIGLDVLAKRSMLTFIQEIHAERGITVDTLLSALADALESAYKRREDA